ncbi:hypothetical protein H4W33_006318 [Kibdelosporangium phytohabitans]|nr:hypothetical protein [Kibdelosporangium phytohabitans]
MFGVPVLCSDLGLFLGQEPPRSLFRACAHAGGGRVLCWCAPRPRLDFALACSLARAGLVRCSRAVDLAGCAVAGGQLGWFRVRTRPSGVGSAQAPVSSQRTVSATTWPYCDLVLARSPALRSRSGLVGCVLPLATSPTFCRAVLAPHRDQVACDLVSGSPPRLVSRPRRAVVTCVVPLSPVPALTTPAFQGVPASGGFESRRTGRRLVRCPFRGSGAALGVRFWCRGPGVGGFTALLITRVAHIRFRPRDLVCLSSRLCWPRWGVIALLGSGR